MSATSNSFDLIRLAASVTVMLSHSFVLTGAREPVIANDYTLGNVAVFFFFSISGYLVYQSLERDPHALRFLARRALRIFPGLAVVLALSALVLGPICSNYPAGEYYASQETWAYLGKIRLYGSDRLPGVFSANPYPDAINSSLWTLKWEWLMYCATAVLAFIPGKRHIALAGFVLVVLTLLVAAYIAFDAVVGIELLKEAGLVKAFTDFIVLATFYLAGAALSMIRKSLRPSVPFSIVVSVGALLLLSSSAGILGLVLAVPVLVVVVGESKLQQRLGLKIRSDLSYGIYIYAFPIQQTVSWGMPGITWYAAFAIVLACTVLMAYISWRWIESPGLSLKSALRSR